MSRDVPAAALAARQVEIDSGGRARTALVVSVEDPAMVPERLLLAVHGSNQSAGRFRASTRRSLDAWVGQGQGVVVYPDSWRGGLWNDARRSTLSRARQDGVDDVALLASIAEEHRERGVRQVVALGFSNGGQLVIRALRDAPGLLDAAVLVGATLPAADNLIEATAPPRAAAMVLVHGTRDPIVPFEGGVASLFGFRPRGQMLSFTDSTRHWVDAAGLHGEPVVQTLPHLHASGTTSVRRIFAALGRPTVVAVTVEGGGHTVPIPRAPGRRITGRTSPDLDLLTEVSRLL